MRSLRVLAALLLLAGALPPAGAQDAPAGEPAPLLEDPVGDVAAMVAGTPAGNPAGRYAAADLTRLAVSESRDAFTFHLGVASLASGPEAPLLESCQYAVEFAYGGNVYRVSFFRRVLDQPQYSGRAYQYDAGRQAFAPLEQVAVSADPASGTLSATVPRALLLDANGAAPFPGTSLTGFRAASSALSNGRDSLDLGPLGEHAFPQTGVHDRMPDSGNGSAELPVLLGVEQSGDARLRSDVPTRASNGEANTFVFVVNATNLGPAQRFALRATGVPATWQVDLPSDLVEVPAESTVSFPVLVSTPFAHQHGTVRTFAVEMAGLDDPGDVGRVQLGLRYLATPQPAGHHDTLFLHTEAGEGDDPTLTTAFATLFGFDPSGLYFNTLAPDQDENDARTPVGGIPFGWEGSPPRQRYTWLVPLSPALQMGLDFDLAREGSLSLAMETTLPMPGAVVSGRFVHTVPEDRDCDGGPGPGGDDDCSLDDLLFGPGRHTEVARMPPTAPVDVPPNSRGVPFTLAVQATPQGDYVPFHPDATLALQLNVTIGRLDPFFGPRDMPKVSGGEMVLPLLEYHDPVDQVFSSLGSLMIAVHGEQQRLVNPGETALFDLELMNHGDEAATYDLELSGQPLAWARVLGDRRVELGPGQSRPLGIAITAPGSAADGAVADLVLSAVDSRDPTARTLARLVATVDADADHPDDSGRVPGLDAQLSARESPGAPLLAFLAAAALVAALRRRAA